jgi:hypothetical protein
MPNLFVSFTAIKSVNFYLPQYLPFEYKEINPSKLENKIILIIGRISPEKQFELGIKAMTIIKNFLKLF